MPRKSREARRMRIKQDLIENLKQDRMTQSYWFDLVDDYLAFWEIKEKLKTEIERNGTMVTIKNGSQVFRKRNDAVAEMPKISKRMTEILDSLNIKASTIEEIDEDDY